MTTVEISAEARRDLQYLRLWLAGHAPGAAKRATQAILAATASLSSFPERGRRVRDNLRELAVLFGSAGYVLQDAVHADQVVIARVFHRLERR